MDVGYPDKAERLQDLLRLLLAEAFVQLSEGSLATVHEYRSVPITKEDARHVSVLGGDGRARPEEREADVHAFFGRDDARNGRRWCFWGAESLYLCGNLLDTRLEGQEIPHNGLLVNLLLVALLVRESPLC